MYKDLSTTSGKTNASITKFVGACEWFCKIFIKPFLVVLSQFKLLMLKNHF